MEKQGLISMVAKITYPEDALTEQEQKALHSSIKHFIYFYGDDDITQNYDSKMEKLWRPGAIAEFYDLKVQYIGSKKSSEKRGEWI